MDITMLQLDFTTDPPSPTTESTTPTPTPTDGILLDTTNRASPDSAAVFAEADGPSGASSRNEKENGHRPPGAIRARHHNHAMSHTAMAEADRRSEASSEVTRVSKFKVVKLESKAPYCRGRWQCFDFHDRPKEHQKNTSAERISSSDQSSISSVPPATLPLTGPAPPTDSDPHHALADRRPSSEAPRTVPHDKSQVIHSQLSGEALGKIMDGILRQESGGSTTTLSGANVGTTGAMGMNDVFLSDSNAALSAELSKRTTGDAALSGNGESGLSLEHKIRQCMDLVGNHLIIAVRGELEHVSSELAKLRDKVEQLEFENSALRSENAILRHAAGSDIPSRAVPSRKK